MSLDLVGALKAPWQKDCGFARIFLGGLCMMIPFLAFVPMGYLAEYLNKLINGKEELGNIFQHGSKSFVIGAKMFLGFVLLNIPYFLIYGILVFALSEKHPILYLGLISLLSLVWCVIPVIMMLSFATDFKILSAVDFDRAVKIIKENPVKIFVAVLLSIVISIVYSLLLAIPYIASFAFAGIAVGMGLYLLAPVFVIAGLAILFTITFAMCVSIYNILGQFARESQYIQAIKQELV